MFQKLAAFAVLFLAVGHLFFRPRLRELGRRIDRFVTLMVWAIVITYAGRLIFFVLTKT